MLARTGLVALGVVVVACSGEVSSEGSAGSGATSGPTSASSVTPTSASGGSGGSSMSTAAGGSGGAVTCNPGAVLCDGPAPTCTPGQVPSIQGSCWGPCVPILECATEPSCDNCQTGFCAEYVAFTTEYRCVMPSLMCSALACSCVAPYFCVQPYDACAASTGAADVTCGCPTC